MTVPHNPTGDGAPSVTRITNGVPEDASLKELLSRMTLDLSRLVRLEVELAKVELKDEVVRGAKLPVSWAERGLPGAWSF